ncbi:ATP synthase subunit K [Halostagnicola larsenii XH-48]|uniref:ATP synthase subunit K n=1 Tax=Halostagnicola larsenii XH-48 TaxID=797299 RepID=W0JSV5_9EURY|nr:ATP synthase subunit K [Halostagnicola larsenii]AHG00275.1 ATP synthase subunit K [Halostagnicola larsenii XH-48]
MIEAPLELGLALNSFAENAVVLQEEAAGGGGPMIERGAAAALGIGLAAIGAGYAERAIGASVVGALAEDSISPGIGILLTVLPETLVIFALVALFVGP